MNKRLFRIFSVIPLVALILSACSGLTSSAPVAASTPLRVSWSLWPGWYPAVIAQQKGLFKKHGVEVELVFYHTYKDQLPALASGLLDGSALVIGDALLDQVAEKVKIVMITDNSNGADQLVAGPGILSPADVVGKKVGVQSGTFGQLLVQEMLKQNKLPIDSVSYVDVSPEFVPNAIPNQIDFGHTFEPYASQARAKGFKPIFTSADTPGLIADVVAFRRKIIEQRPEDVKAFIAAWFEAAQYWQANPKEGNAIIATATGQKEKDISLEGVKMFDLPANLNAFKPGNDTTSLYFTAQYELRFLVDTGVISNPVKPEDLLDSSFLQ